MGYLPKRLVNANLITGGAEFLEENNSQPYEGAYHTLFNGESFTGPNPTSPNKKRLIPNPNRKQQQVGNTMPGVNNDQYSRTNSVTVNVELLKFGKDPEPHFPQPTGEDYKKGRIIRYFAKRANQTPEIIREISENAYNDLEQQGGEYNYSLWRVTSLFWKISGPIRDSRDRNGIVQKGILDTNQRLLEEANKNFRGLKAYLNDPIQLAQKPDLELISNRYTAGNEFTVKQDNSNYQGYYHIMADGTIMSGQTHGQADDKILLAGNVVVQNQISTLVKQELEKIGTPSNEIRNIPQQSVVSQAQLSTLAPPTGRSSGEY